MFETLAAYLDVAASPEQRAVCMDACQTLVEAGITDHEFLIDQELAVADSYDGDFLIHLHEELLKPIYVNVLREFGVRLTAEATLAQHVDVLKAMHAVDNYDDQQALLGYCESNDGAEAALADILELLGAYHSTEYLTVLDFVSPSVLERIAEICTQEPDEPLPASALVDRARVRVTKFLGLAETADLKEDSVFRQAVVDGLRFGLSMDDAVAPYRTQLSERPAPQLVQELVGFALSTGNDDAFMRTLLSKELDHYSLTPDLVLKMDVFIGDLLRKTFNA
jgi:hypothetical protein